MHSFFVCWNQDGGKERGLERTLCRVEIDREVVDF